MPSTYHSMQKRIKDHNGNKKKGKQIIKTLNLRIQNKILEAKPVVVVNSVLNRSSMDTTGLIRIFGLAKLLRWIPFRPQPSVFIWAGDQHNETPSWAPSWLHSGKQK